jgi:hypothetical protein
VAGQVDAATACFLRESCLITPGATAVHGREDICLVLVQLVALCVRVEVESTGLVEAGEMALVHQRCKIALNATESDPVTQTTTPLCAAQRRIRLETGDRGAWGAGERAMEIATPTMGGNR